MKLLQIKFMLALLTASLVACLVGTGPARADSPISSPHPFPAAIALASIGAGLSHTCAVRSDGTVDCWGDNSFGQSTEPAGSFTQVSVGQNHSCGVRSNGTADCWGSNGSGQSTDPAGTFVQVSAGNLYSCGLKTNGTVDCWGSNSAGQSTDPAGTFTQVSAGAAHTCGVRTNGTVDCWGSNSAGQSTDPAGSFIQVSAGGGHTCGLKTDGAVDCWGSNGIGQSTNPAGTFIQVSAGTNQNCAIRTDGTVDCWGLNTSGQGTDPVGTFTYVDGGGWHNCGVRTNGSADCWGLNDNAQATDQTISAYNRRFVDAGNINTCAVQTNGLVDCWGDNSDGQSTDPVGTFTQISAGGAHTCGVRTNGLVDCWGYNGEGQSTDPVGTFTRISAGSTHTCGVRTNGLVDCWGYNGSGQSTDPAGSFVHVSAGGSHTCGLKTNGTVDCWGSGYSNDPGGTFTQVSAGHIYTCGIRTDSTLDCWGPNGATPPIDPAGTFIQVSMGYEHNCGVRTNGTVDCWGRNYWGESTDPAGTFTRVSAGDTHTCGVKTDGAIHCWGNDLYWQLGPLEVSIGGWPMSGHDVQNGHITHQSYPGINDGPVVIGGNGNVLPLITSQEAIYKINGVNTSFSKVMALPDSQVSTTFWLPWYNNVELNTQLRFTSVDGLAFPATVHVYIGGTEMPGSPFMLLPYSSMRKSFAGINNGPVKIESDANIVVAERVIYKVNGANTSFSETMALPNKQMDTTYWLPWYNNTIASGLDTQLRFANVGNATATVHIFIGGVEMGSGFSLAAGASTRQTFPNVNNGPVKIVSDQPIVAAERAIYKVNGVNTSYSEMIALPHSQLDTTYWLPWYNNVEMDTQLRFANVGNATTTVHVLVGGQEMPGSPFSLAPNASTRMSFAGVNYGPVKIVSDHGVPIVAAERVIYKVNGVNTSFSEMMALPNKHLDTLYWLPWYNNVELDTQLRFGVP